MIVYSTDLAIEYMPTSLNTNLLHIHLDNSYYDRTLPHSPSGDYYEDSGEHASHSFTGARGDPRAAHHPPLCCPCGEPPCTSVREISVDNGSDALRYRRGKHTPSSVLYSRTPQGQKGF